MPIFRAASLVGVEPGEKDGCKHFYEKKGELKTIDFPCVEFDLTKLRIISTGGCGGLVVLVVD